MWSSLIASHCIFNNKGQILYYDIQGLESWPLPTSPTSFSEALSCPLCYNLSDLSLPATLEATSASGPLLLLLPLPRCSLSPELYIASSLTSFSSPLKGHPLKVISDHRSRSPTSITASSLLLDQPHVRGICFFFLILTCGHAYWF